MIPRSYWSLLLTVDLILSRMNHCILNALKVDWIMYPLCDISSVLVRFVSAEEHFSLFEKKMKQYFEDLTRNADGVNTEVIWRRVEDGGDSHSMSKSAWHIID